MAHGGCVERVARRLLAFLYPLSFAESRRVSRQHDTAIACADNTGVRAKFGRDHPAEDLCRGRGIE